MLHTTRETVIIEVADRPLFGRVIKQLRDRRGLTQRALAELIRPEPDGRSITTQYLSDIESGRRSPSGDHIISAISIGLGVDPNYLAYVARMLPPEIRDLSADEFTVRRAIAAFRSAMENDTHAETASANDLLQSRIMSFAEKGTLSVEFGRYFSLPAVPNRPLSATFDVPYVPEWQVALKNRLFADVEWLIRRTKPGSPPLQLITTRIESRLEEEYKVELELERGVIVFESIFATRKRRQRLLFDPQGTVSDFALVYVNGGRVQNLLGLVPDERHADGDPHRWISDVEGHALNVFAPNYQAVKDILNDASDDKRLSPDRKAEIPGQIVLASDMLDWLKREKSTGLIACDVGISVQLLARAPDLGFGDKEVVRTFVSYPEELQTGTASLESDPDLHMYLRRRRLEIIKYGNKAIQDSWEDTCNRMRQLHISPVAIS